MRLSWVVPIALGLAAPVGLVAGSPATARPACAPRPAGSAITLAATDNGRAVCAHRGERIDVVLQVDVSQAPEPEQWWQPVTLDGSSLTVLPQTKMAMRGTTLASYSATAHGTATLTSYRSLCAAPKPGTVSCMAMAAWSVRVTVR